MSSTPNPTTLRSGVDTDDAAAPRDARGPHLFGWRERRFAALVIAAISTHCVMTLMLAWLRYASVHNRTFDLALYGRLAWGLVHGRPWDPIVGGHFFGGHVPFVLWPLGALGSVLGTVPVLLAAQSAAVALAAWPLYRIATRRMSPAAASAVALAWLLYPNLGHVASYEMHPGTLAVLPMCAAFDALDRRMALRFVGLCAIVVACRASLGLQTCVLGLIVIALHSGAMRRAGVAVALGSALYFGVVQGVLAPRLGPALIGSLDLHFGRWGGSPTGIFGALLERPLDVVQHFADSRRLSYLPRVLAPLAFLPLVRPRWALCALPPLAINLISEFPTTTELYSHYLTPALPALAFAAIEGASTLAARRVPAAPALLLASVAATCLRGGLPWSWDFRTADFLVDSRSLAAREILRRIPAGASVQAPDALLPHLCERPLLGGAPPPARGTQYVVLDAVHRPRFARSEDLLRTTEEPVMRAWLARPDYGLIAASGDFLLLSRGASGRAGPAAQYFATGLPRLDRPAIRLSGCLGLTRATLGEQLVLEFAVSTPCSADLAVRWGSEAVPSRVDLLFDGLLSPAQLRSGDRVRSRHRVSAQERVRLEARGLRVGLLRANGRPPQASDPMSAAVPLERVVD